MLLISMYAVTCLKTKITTRRCGLDQNMIVFSGIEWRNPPAFHHTPYLLRIDELSFIIDAESLWRAFCRKGALKVSGWCSILLNFICCGVREG